MPQLSELPGYDVDEDADGFCARIIEFFTSEYFALMESAEYHVIYHYDDRWPQLSDVFSSSGGGIGMLNDADNQMWGPDTEDAMSRAKSKTSTWKEITEHSDMCGFDMITAVSQSAINTQLYSMWESSKNTRDSSGNGLLAKWSFQGCFEGNFQPITIRLLSHGAAIIWVHLEEGTLKALKNWQPCAE